jgi:hypothetical protein
MGTGTHGIVRSPRRSRGRATFRRALLGVALVLVAWGVVVNVTGGFVLDLPWGPVSSRGAIRPLVGAGLLLLYYAVYLREHWRDDVPALARVVPHSLAAAAIVSAIVTGEGWGTRIAGGPDASGYVSQAAMLARGDLTMPAPRWIEGATWNEASASASPVGYRPAEVVTRLAPTYAPGLPLIMAGFERAFGPAAVFYVVPLAGALGVWATWSLGRRLGSEWVGAIAAILIATNPVFLMMLVQPMSDVPAATFWTLSLAASLRGSSIAAGASAAIAILVRPNLVPLTAVPLLLLIVRDSAWRARATLLFLAPVLVAAAMIAGLNWHYYGSPLKSGYGSLGDLYSLERVGTNLHRYATWFVTAHTPLLSIGVLAPAFCASGGARVTGLLVTTAFPLAVLASYLLYLVFFPEEWLYLRFLLPGYPALTVGCAIVVLAMAVRVAGRRGAVFATSLVVSGIAVYGWNYAMRQGLTNFRRADLRYARSMAYVQRLPQDSVIVSLAHSGPVRFYTGREVLRFDAIAPADIDRALAHAETRGYTVCVIGDRFEIDMFRARFAGTHTASRLAQAPGIDLGDTLAFPLGSPEGSR